MGLVRGRSVAMLMGCAVIATIAANCWWMLVDEIPPARALASPIPYAMLFLALVIGLPIYLGFRDWFDASILRPLAVAILATAPAVAYAMNYFLYPRDVFAAFLLLSTACIGASAFCLLARHVEK